MAETSDPQESVDAVIIGGGFFGCSMAVMLRERGLRPVIIERADRLLTRASYNNQARVHSGYHYPRSLMTALRSSVNFPRFVAEFSECVDSDFEKYYAIGSVGSKVSAQQFEVFMKRIGAPLKPAPARVQKLFNKDLVESVWLTRETAFDARKLAGIMQARLQAASVPVLFHTEATGLAKTGDDAMRVTIKLPDHTLRAIHCRWVFNCTYSRLNHLQESAGLPAIPLKHELTEMPLVVPPDSLRGISITMMCGPYFSLMPFPDRGCCTLSHVRYTPHTSWTEGTQTGPDPYRRFDELPKQTNFPYMIRDAARYVPEMTHCTQRGSIWEIKTVLPQSEIDDGRPILFTRSAAAPRLIHVMGGKIDNIYDIPQELDQLPLAA